MFYCDKCGSTDCCERTDLVNEPVLCDKCYAEEIRGIKIMFGFLDALNNACFKIAFQHTLPFTEKQENVLDKYFRRKRKLNKLRKKINSCIKWG